MRLDFIGLFFFLGLVPSFSPAQIILLGDSTQADASSKASLEHTAPIDEAVTGAEARLKIGGALRFNYQFRDWSEFHQQQGGALTFDTWRLNVDAQAKGILLSMEYRFYSGFHMFHHGWFGYNFSPQTQLQLGINQVPFGLLPYASHSWWFQTAYYVGLEDDYDMGLKLTHQTERWNLALAFYKEAEPTLSGSTLASARYSYDLVPTSNIDIPHVITTSTPGADLDSVATSLQVSSQNREINQLNARATFRPIPELEAGLSLQAGQVYNPEALDFGRSPLGSHQAFALHAEANLAGFNLLAEYIFYQYNLPDLPDISEEVVIMGAYDFPYQVAAQAELYMLGLSYTLPVDWGPISSLTFYDNYTYMDKANPRFIDTQQHVIGCLISAGQLYTYLDLASGRNHPWLGPFEENWNQALSQGAVDANQVVNSDPDWHTRLNVNLGYYF